MIHVYSVNRMPGIDIFRFKRVCQECSFALYWQEQADFRAGHVMRAIELQ